MKKAREGKPEKKLTAGEARNTLTEIELKLRGIAYLFFNQNDDPAPPKDMIDIQQGLGMTLEGLANELLEVHRSLDVVRSRDAALQKGRCKRNRKLKSKDLSK